jgi:hypothetical protein
LRPGNAGANTAADHIEVLKRALAQLPEGAAGRGTLVRCDSAGASHDFLRQRAAIEDSIRCAKASGLRNLPLRAYAMNAAWLELVLTGIDLLPWTRRLLLRGTDLAVCEPKRLRYRLLHVAAHIARHAGGVRLRLPRPWPWTQTLASAFASLQVLPSG